MLSLTTELYGNSRAPRQTDQALSLFERYARDGSTGLIVFKDSRQFVGLLEGPGRAWIAAAPPAEQTHRREVLAVLALETAASAGRDTGLPILEWACAMLRHQPPSAFEREWMVASTAVFPRTDLEQNGIASAGLGAHLRHALAVFPDDPRLRLEALLESRFEFRALANRPGADLGKLVRNPTPDIPHLFDDSGPKGSDRVADSLKRLGSLASDPIVGPEARLHMGLLEFHANRLDASDADLRAAASGGDPFVQNLAWTMIGVTADAEAHPSDAVDAYRRAVTALPAARASAVALAAHLVMAGDRDGATAVLDRAYDAFPPGLDPWHHIIAPERSFPAEVAALRAMCGLPHAAVSPAPAATRVAPVEASSAAPAGAGDAGPFPPDGRATFRSVVSGVTFDVSVTSHHVPVDGLSGRDFVVLDNGVPQRIEVRRVEDLPIDISLVLSFYVDRGAGTYDGGRTTRPGLLKSTIQDAQEIVKLVRPSDRLRVIEVDGDGAEIWPLQPPTGDFGIDRLPNDRMPMGLSYGRVRALYDAAGAALFRSAPAGRRHVVIVFADGTDGGSVLSAPLFLSAAREAASVMYLVGRETVAQEAAKVRGQVPQWDAYSDWLWPSDPHVIEEAAEATGGGRYFSPNGFVATDFKEIMDRFRRSYVIHYTAAGVVDTGWHDLTVKVVRQGAFEVAARKGYQGGR